MCDQITIADIFAFNEILNLQITDFNPLEYEHIAKWFEGISKFPEVQASLESFNEFKNKVKADNN